MIRKPTRAPSPAERHNARHLAHARQRAGITGAIREKADREQQRDAAERAHDEAIARSIEWGRRQYVLNLPTDFDTKLHLLGVTDNG